MKSRLQRGRRLLEEQLALLASSKSCCTPRCRTSKSGLRISVIACCRPRSRPRRCACVVPLARDRARWRACSLTVCAALSPAAGAQGVIFSRCLGTILPLPPLAVAPRRTEVTLPDGDRLAVAMYSPVPTVSPRRREVVICAFHGLGSRRAPLYAAGGGGRDGARLRGVDGRSSGCGQAADSRAASITAGGR